MQLYDKSTRRQFLATSALSAASFVVANGATSSESRASEPRAFRKIKIGQIGVRHEHAPGKMNSLRMLSDYFEIVGIAAESPEWEEKNKGASCYDGLRWTSQEELLATPGLEAIAVETEMTELLPTAKRCAERGLHMHLDKPLGQNLDECRELFDLCRARNVVVQPGYMFRTNQGVRLAIRAVKEGWLGEIAEARANMNRNDVDPNFRRWLATYRGGGMYDFGSHLVDFIVEMLGAPDEIQVVERPLGDDGLNDNTLTLFLYAKTIAQIRVTERAIDGFPNRRLSIIGTKGSFDLYPLENWSVNPETGKVPPLNVTLTLDEGNAEYHKGVNKIQLDAVYNDRYVGQLIEFAKYVRGEKVNPYSFEDELLVQKAILAASGYIPWTKEN